MAPKKQKKPQKKSKVASKKKSKEATKKPPVLSASVCGEVLCSAVDAANTTASLKDVLEANGEEHLYNKIVELSVHVEENPPVIFGWQHVEEFVLAIETARALAGEPGGEPLPVDPLGLPEVVTVQNSRKLCSSMQASKELLLVSTPLVFYARWLSAVMWQARWEC